MNKYVIMGICLIVIILVIVIVKIKILPEKSAKELKLTYKMSAGIPFKRVYEIEDESIVQFVKSYIVKNENTNGKVGAPIYTAYVFKGLKEGVTSITFKIISITDENNVMSEEKNKVEVDKNLNITLVEK